LSGIINLVIKAKKAYHFAVIEPEDFEGRDGYPWPDVEEARDNVRLQRGHPIEEGYRNYLAAAKPCPQCQAAPEQLSWFYFSSPSATWKDLCGTSGWMTVCDRCHLQVNYFMEVMS
jgi:hypothetical protein